MGFWLSIWRAYWRDRQMIETKIGELRAKANRAEAERVALREELLAQDELLRQISIAVGRVKVIKDFTSPGPPYGGLPELVAMVASDHDDLEGRIDAVADYLRSFGPDEVPVTAAELRTKVGQLIQGADPQIVDLQGGTDIKEE